MKPLIAAEATTFVLIQKIAKNQDNKYASALPAGSLRFFRCSALCAFTSHKKLNRHSHLRWPALVAKTGPLLIWGDK
jgi:hypothetical protein